MSNFRFYKYEIGQIFRPHFDDRFTRNSTESSKLTFMIYLSDGLTGGETIFYFDSTKIRARILPKKGMALVFDHLQLHEGAPVKSSVKYVLRSDVMYTGSDD
ncbi:2OG-Fe(II) oxygenase [Telmatocola sphagniphila]|uniref:2OG-Fe(II) oxygenase n=2 Tax=Telmatocola sphagniphila TaxID=1123043 RepID=A0A8E6BBX6_9BACT|nr:2OG-Fe(II) oxygenase [Telmatocola sphagniphila]